MKFVFGLLPRRPGQDYRDGGYDTQTRISIRSNRIITCVTDQMKQVNALPKTHVFVVSFAVSSQESTWVQGSWTAIGGGFS
jgi:hypothetical protein